MDAERLKEEIAMLHQASFQWALRCCDGRREEAEDVLQTAYLRVLEGRSPFRGRSALKTWLFAVVRRTAAARWRRRARRESLAARWLPALPASSGTPPGPAEAAVRGERAERIRKALGCLSRRQLQVLDLVFYHDLTLGETAEVLGLSAGSVRVHYHRGKERLRSWLEEEER